MRDIKVWVQDKGRGMLRMQWTNFKGERETLTAGTKDRKVAEERAAELQQRLNAGGEVANFSMRWQEFRAFFFEEYVAIKNLRGKTGEKYECVFDVFDSVCKPRKIIDVDTKVVNRFVKGMRERKVPGGKIGLSPWTQRNYLVALKTAMEWALDRKVIIRCPTFPTIKVPKRRPQPIAEADFHKLLAAAPDDTWRAYMLFGWYEGMRLAEVLLMRWERNDEAPWLDLAGGRINLPAEFSKNGQDDWMPLHPVVTEAMAAVPRTDQRVFPFRSRKGGDYLTRNGMSNRIILIARRAGVKLSMHRLRKGFGCRVAQQLGKGNAPMLHRLMRHSSMQITMDYYSSVDDVLGDVMKELK